MAAGITSIDDPAVVKIETAEPEPSQSTRDKNRDDDGDADHAFDGSVDLLAAQWHACIDELQQLQQAAAASSSPTFGLSALLKAQQQTLDKMQRRRTAGKLSRDNHTAFKGFCWHDRWTVVKKCHGLVCIDNVSFPRSPRVPAPPGAGWLSYKDGVFQEKTIVIDAVVDSGATWLKFVSISTRNLEFQVLCDGTESEDEEAIDWLGHSNFAETIRNIVLAARWNHCHHVHLVLPRLREGESEVVDKVLNAVRNKIGGGDVKITTSCANSEFLTRSPPELSAAISALVREREPLVAEDCRRLTPVINLDPTVLTALVTDLHHGPISFQPVAQQELIAHTLSSLDNDTEDDGQVRRSDILARVLLPALRGRKLVCTKLAAKYFRQLIGAISTSSEEVRAALILPPEGAENTHEELIKEFRKWSNVVIPHDLLLPVQVVDDIAIGDVETLVESGQLPSMALGVARDLSPLNRSIYLYGWANRLTTVTSHRGIERQILLSVARHWKRGDDRPPDVWHRLLSPHLFLRDKPKDWRDFIASSGEVPQELMKWTLPWTTWGRGIDAHGLPDTKTWPGVGHDEMVAYGRKTERRAARDNGGGETS